MRVNGALAEIESSRNHDFVAFAYKEVRADLASHKDRWNVEKYEFAESTFESLFLTFQSKSSLSQFSSESERLDEINRLTKGKGAEAGFSSGKSPEEIEKGLTRKIQTSLMAFQKSKEQRKY